MLELLFQCDLCQPQLDKKSAIFGFQYQFAEISDFGSDSIRLLELLSRRADQWVFLTAFLRTAGFFRACLAVSDSFFRGVSVVFGG